ncbi:hypothetical protein AC630_15645 [Bradyrhizobium sp. AS23.2]|nr:hypothetical protein AC630_15645 [Bradyrhizobium sp. AS23.2]
MVVGTSNAKQRNPCESLILKKELGDLMSRRSRNCLQSRRSVQMYNCWNVVLPLLPSLLIETLVGIWPFQGLQMDGA